jgi:Bacterial archaeo-eukaryotic release factor family 5
MRLPGPETLKELVGWQPADGVLSLYVNVDPSDRGRGWRVALLDGLRAAFGDERELPHERRLSVRATAERALGRFPERGPPPEGRGQVGLVEVASEPGRELWYASRIPPRATEVVYGHRPYLRPLIEMIDTGARIGVAAVSGDQVRLWEWEMGTLSELDDLSLTTTGDWRERKAQRPSDPARFHGAGASGREQHDQRLEAHRERFLKDTAARTATTAGQHGWRDLLVFGENEHVRRFADSLDKHEPRHVHGKNVASEPSARIAERVAELIPELNRERELKLVDTVKETAYSGKARGSLGPQETLEALSQGRVEHLLFDADRDYRGESIEQGLAYEGPPFDDDGLPVAELMIERALETSARITPLDGDAAAALQEHDGVAALLRY